LAVILIDAEKGLLPQTTRHAHIAALLGIPTVVAAINKMDLVGYRQQRFLTLEKDFLALAEKLGIASVQCIPISALVGDNVVECSKRTGWYAGPALLEHLETVPVTKAASTHGIRFPVQYVIRPDANFRGFAGQLAGGVIRPGDAVIALPSGQQSRVEEIVTYDGHLAEAFAPMSVTLKLADEIDLSRGDMLVAPDSPPNVSQRFRAAIVWMHAQPLKIRQAYLIKQGVRQVRGAVARIQHRVNINTLETESSERLEINDIAVVEFETNSPLFFDSYKQNRTTGSFIVIDPLTNATVGAGMIQESLTQDDTPTRRESPSTEALLTPLERYRRHAHYPAIILTNSRAALARRIERALFEMGFEVMVIDETEAPFASARSAWAALHAAGFVVVYHHPKSGSHESAELRAAAGDRFFDLAEMNLPAGDAEALEHVLTFAKSLRISYEDGNPGR
jgi:sulfate adenylyltransferase large subunit